MDASRPRRCEPARFEPESINQEAFTYYRRLHRLRRFVDSNYGEPIPLGRAAAVVGLERTYFSKFFHAKTGVPFHRWLSYVRVARARELIEGRNLAITEVAFRVGFNDLRTFERAFKRCSGVTPQAYKQAVRPA